MMDDRLSRGPYKKWREDATQKVPKSTLYRHKRKRAAEMEGDDDQLHPEHLIEPQVEAEDTAIVSEESEEADSSGSEEADAPGSEEEDTSGSEDAESSSEEAASSNEDGEEESDNEEDLGGPELPGAGNVWYDPLLNENLHDHTTFTVGKLMYKLTKMFVKHKFSKACLVDILDLITECVPIGHKVPNSKYKFFKLIFQLSPHKGVYEKHFLCGNPKCQTYFGSKENVPVLCPVCQHKEKAMFIRNNIGVTLKYFLEKGDLASVIDANIPVQSTLVKDITDGEKYKALPRRRYDITTITSTDGAPMSESSKLQVWPIFSMPVEVPIKQRSRFMILAGIWIGPDKPKINTYLMPFAEENAQLCTEGFDWTHPNTKAVHNSKVFSALYSVDAQARAPMQNLSLYNALNGCGVCEADSETVEVGRGHAKIYPYIDPPAQRRSNERMLQQAKSASPDNPVKGVKGPSCLSLIPCVDIAEGFVPEYLHGVCLGDTRHFVYCWLDPKNKGKPFYLGDVAGEIDAKLLSITPTSMVKRLPRSIVDAKHWKGSEFRSWLLYYSLYCLENIWPVQYLQHWMLLVNAIYLLLKESIMQSEIELANVLLNMFCKDVETLYGIEHMTYNMHQLLHLADSVRNWGPLSATSVFPFENETGQIKFLGHGSSNMVTELANSMELVNSLKVMRLLFDEHIGHMRLKVTDKGVSKITLPPEVMNFLHNSEDGPENYLVHNRAVCNNMVLTSESYKRSRKTSNKLIQYLDASNNIKFGKIIKFIKPENSEIVLVVIHEINVQDPYFIHHKTGVQTNHIVPYIETNNLKLIELSSIQYPLIEVGRFICFPPNFVEINL